MRMPSDNRLTHRALVICGVLGIALTAAVADADERFLLKVAGTDDLTSVAEFERERLVITDPQGQVHIYNRAPDLDSADGRYSGYYSRGAKQALRWPTTDAGAMLIGDAAGRDWRASRQRIQAIQPRNPRPPRPGDDPQIVNKLPAGDPQEGRTRRGPVAVAHHRVAERQLEAAYIDNHGRLQRYSGWHDKWRPQDTRVMARLAPGAPLAFADHPSRRESSLYTVDSAGRLIEIVDGREARALPVDVELQPASHLTINSDPTGAQGFVVDRRGRLWQLGLSNGRHEMIDKQQNRFHPGLPLAYVPQNAGHAAQLFAVDRRGSLIGYSWMRGGWSGPAVISGGLAPGTPVAAEWIAADQGDTLLIAAVDLNKRLHLLQQRAGKWSPYSMRGTDQLSLLPGTSLALNSTNGSLNLSAVDRDGVWRHWHAGPKNVWQAETIASGFPVTTPIGFDVVTMTGFGVDATGRLVTAAHWDNTWHSYLCLPDVPLAPRLIERELIASQSLPPARVRLVNSGRDELTVQLFDAFGTRAPRQFDIPPGGSVPVELQRSAGATLRESFAVPTPAGWVEDVAEFHVPPQPRYSAVAWTKQVTYSYVDPENVSVLPDFDLKTHQSLGVFSLPPGTALQDGDAIDVFEEAWYQGNPGAAAWFGPPAGGPEFIPRPDR